eukprot:CAMPEP_0167830320 /NCGR_PEP_ID=MMETSP0112_2-20121227/12858_1 /TAXON_ID=91324 /ORGANISM="Lotharella globosa, Strain CCCM811" /LENGTH=61 /DNA_ID=CAMNT_0007734529 /DNA_START=77 /DNA_END=258 /DNA_ORIENTATION=+
MRLSTRHFNASKHFMSAISAALYLHTRADVRCPMSDDVDQKHNTLRRFVGGYGTIVQLQFT